MEQQMIQYFANKQERTEWHDRYYFNKAVQQFQPLLNKLLALYVAKNRRHEYKVCAEVALFRALETFDSTKGKLVTYIYVYVKHALCNEMRQDNQFLARNIPVEDTALHIMCEHRHEHEHLEHVHAYFDKHIRQRVTKEELAFLVALYLEGYSYRTLSEQLGVSVETLKKRRNRLIARLRAEKAKSS